MRYKIDHDLHIHSFISSCSHDPEQTSERILRYAEENGFSQICLTDHFWDESVEGASNWYSKQNYAHIAAALPLPKSDRVEFLFGAETEMNKNLVLGISKKRFDDFQSFMVKCGLVDRVNENNIFMSRDNKVIKFFDSVNSESQEKLNRKIRIMKPAIWITKNIYNC